MYKLFLTLRYLRKRRIAIFAVISVWLCVAMEVTVFSVMDGFLDTLKERSRGLLSDIVIDNASLQGFPFYQEFAEHLFRVMPDVVEAATPVIYNYGILRVEATSFTKAVRTVGIRLREYTSVNDFGSSLYYDKHYPGSTSLGLQRKPVVGFNDKGLPILPEDLESSLRRWIAANPDAEELDSWQRRAGSVFPGPGVFEHVLDGPPSYVGAEAPGVIVGTNIINQRTRTGAFERPYPRGSKLVLGVFPMTGGGRLSGEGATTIAVRLADDSRTRVYEIDNLCCYVDFDMLQDWLGMSAQELESGGFTPPRASQVLVRLAEGADLAAGRADIEREWKTFLASRGDEIWPMDAQLLSFVTVETWEERQVQFIAAVEKEKILVSLLFGVISLVAVVLIGCIFWMIVTQKTRDIGIIKSIGASSAGVAAVFVAFGAVVGVLGSVLGSITGAAFVWYINDIQDFLVSIHPQLRVWSPDVYTFDRIPNVVKVQVVLTISLVAMIASVLGALIPATLAGRVWPVKALRYE